MPRPKRGMTTETLTITRRGACVFAAASLIPSAWAMAQSTLPAEFPKRPMTLISPLAPGGAVDVLARLLMEAFQARSGHAVTVENRTGGAGNIGIDAVRRASADGTTLLVVPAGNLTINPTLIANLSFDVERDFAPITILGTAANLFVVGPSLGIKTIPELIAKARQTTMTYGTPGIGSQLHLAMELFKQRTGVEITHVPYRGMPPAPVVLPVIKDSKVIPLALTTAERSPLAPQIPTLAEAGVPGIDVTSWYGLLAPRTTPKPVIDAIFTVTSDILASREVQEKLEPQGLSVSIEPPEVFADRIRRETATWRELIRQRNITAN
jgi:tripartite-type tricarboxylate transporter receptor subunit TctC